jgi:two-component system cell cycle response regulator DivK
VTTFALRDDEDRFRDAGCDGSIAKPISRPDFLKIVEQFLDYAA